MIILTKLSGERFALNPDLVQRVEASHDTVVTLVDGAKYLVAESLDVVAERMLAYRWPSSAAPGDHPAAPASPTTPTSSRRPDARSAPAAPPVPLRRGRLTDGSRQQSSGSSSPSVRSSAR